MEYQYQLDPATGNTRALFSFEHQVFGPWLEVEVGHDADKLAQLLIAIDDVSHDKTKEIMIAGSEYSVILDEQDVCVKTNMSLNGDNIVPDNLVEQDLGFETNEEAMCGLEDFRALLLSWSKFITK